MSFDLKMIGAADRVYEQFQPYRDQGFALGRISAAHRDQYRLYTGQGEVRGEVIGALLFRAPGRAALPAVGDWVAARDAGGGLAMIHAVLPRWTKFSRRAAGDSEDEQVIAANIDLALIVCGLDHDFNPRRIERYLTLAREGAAEAAVLLNKADLCPDVEARVEEARAVAGGAPVIPLSARSPDGAAPILPLLGSGRTLALLGSSGVGKSTLVNQLLGQERQRVEEVRSNDSRGRHTTTFRELVPLPSGGALIDTPGLRELQLWAGQDSLDSAFDEVARLALHCRFRDCGHNGEDGCAVAEALAEGTLDPARWESYRKLRAEIRFHERQVDANAARAEKQRWKKIHKSMRAYYRGRR
jgi:ribosome biogenesis GTPase